MQLLLLIAQVQAAASDLSGNAGWAGAGLLGLVLCWLLFFHLPAKDKQIEKLVAEFKATIALVTEHCEREMIAATTRYREDAIAASKRYREDIDRVIRLLTGKDRT